MLVSQCVRPELLGAEVASEVFLVVERRTFHVMFAKSVLPLERLVLVVAVLVGAKESAVLLAHRIVRFRDVVHCLKMKQSECLSSGKLIHIC